jgi:hypothetical protein
LRPEVEQYYDEARIILEYKITQVDGYFISRFPWLRVEYDSLGSYVGAGSGVMLTTNGDIVQEGTDVSEKVVLRSATIKWREGDEVNFPGLSVELPSDANFHVWVDYLGVLQISGELPDRVNSRISTFFCDEDYAARAVRDYTQTLPVCEERVLAASCDEEYLTKVFPLYRMTTREGRVIDIEDLRKVDTTYEPPIMKYLTEPGDETLQVGKETIDNFFTDYLNPLSAGYQFIPCSARIRRRENFIETVLAAESNLSIPGLNSAEYIELEHFKTKTHMVLDWLAQHFGFIDSDRDPPLYKNWHNLTGSYVSLSITEKRHILHNGFTSGRKDLYPFNAYIHGGYQYNSNWGAPYYHSYDRWKGIQRMKGTYMCLHFFFDVLNLNGMRHRADHLTPDVGEFTMPLRLRKFSRPAVSDEVGDVTPLRVGIDRVSTPDVRPQLRIPTYYERNSEAYNRVMESVYVYSSPRTIKTGYFYFMTGISTIGEPIYGLWDETGSGYDETVDPQDYVAVNKVIQQTLSEATSLDLFALGGISAPVEDTKIRVINIHPEIETFDIQILGNGIVEFTPIRGSTTFRVEIICERNPSIRETIFLELTSDV